MKFNLKSKKSLLIFGSLATLAVAPIASTSCLISINPTLEKQLDFAENNYFNKIERLSKRPEFKNPISNDYEGPSYKDLQLFVNGQKEEKEKAKDANGNIITDAEGNPTYVIKKPLIYGLKILEETIAANEKTIKDPSSSSVEVEKLKEANKELNLLLIEHKQKLFGYDAPDPKNPGKTIHHIGHYEWAASNKEYYYETFIRNISFAEFGQFKSRLKVEWPNIPTTFELNYEKTLKIFNHYIQNTPYGYLFYTRNLLQKSADDKTTTYIPINTLTPGAYYTDNYYFDEFSKAMQKKDSNNKVTIASMYSNLLRAFVENNYKIKPFNLYQEGKSEDLQNAFYKADLSVFPILSYLRNADPTYSSYGKNLIVNNMFKEPITDPELIKSYIKDPVKFVDFNGEYKQYLKPLDTSQLSNATNIKEVEDGYKASRDLILNHGSTEETVARLFAATMFFGKENANQLLKAYDTVTNSIIYYIEIFNPETNKYQILNVINDLESLKADPNFKETILDSKPATWVDEVPESVDLSTIKHLQPYELNRANLSYTLDLATYKEKLQNDLVKLNDAIDIQSITISQITGSDPDLNALDALLTNISGYTEEQQETIKKAVAEIKKVKTDITIKEQEIADSSKIAKTILIKELKILSSYANLK